MTIPGFSAETSLGPTKGVYRGNAFLSRCGMAAVSSAGRASGLYELALAISDKFEPAKSSWGQIFIFDLAPAPLISMDVWRVRCESNIGTLTIT
jgi:hypothetical protein